MHLRSMSWLQKKKLEWPWMEEIQVSPQRVGLATRGRMEEIWSSAQPGKTELLFSTRPKPTTLKNESSRALNKMAQTSTRPSSRCFG